MVFKNGEVGYWKGKKFSKEHSKNMSLSRGGTGIVDRKKYLKNWQRNNKEKRREYERRYKLKHPEKIKEKEKRRSSKPHRIEYMKQYKKEYIKRLDVKKKHQIRVRTNKKYGKSPSGFEKHHLTYDNPDEFLIVPIEEHTKIHNHKM